jgi:biopolymer transport protein ExbB/TolQ
MKYTFLISSIIFIIFLSLFNFSLAQEGLGLESEEKISFDFINQVKRAVEGLPQEAARGMQYLMQKAEERFDLKKAEIKEEIKQEAKEQVNRQVEKKTSRIKNWLNPLKSKIQEGSALIRKVIYRIKDFLFDFFK